MSYRWIEGRLCTKTLPRGTPPCPETQVVKEAGTEQEVGLSTSQEGAPQLLCKAWPLESLSTKGYLVETPKDHQLNQENGQRETKGTCVRGVWTQLRLGSRGATEH